MMKVGEHLEQVGINLLPRCFHISVKFEQTSCCDCQLVSIEFFVEVRFASCDQFQGQHHRFFEIEEIEVRVSHFTVEKGNIHEYYDHNSHDNDIAVLEIEGSFDMTSDHILQLFHESSNYDSAWQWE